MTIEISRENLVTDAEENSNSETKRPQPNSDLTHRNTRISLDGIPCSITKRRLSNTSSNTSSETRETESVDPAKMPNDIQNDECEIRKDSTQTKQRIKLFADVPDPFDEKITPDEFLHKCVYAWWGLELEPKRAKSLENFFAKVTDEQIAAYSMTVVSACRSNDLDALKKLHSEGQIMNCFNRFGESLLTMACRRGFENVVEYLLSPSSNVDVRISDDGGRTVLHDACWNPSPQLKICKWILERDPTLFFIADNRGCTPFQYARPEHWGIWRQFLLDNKDSLEALTKEGNHTKLLKA